MKLKNPMLVVKDMNQTIEFYYRVLGLRVIMDFGENKTLTGGLSLQTLDTYTNFIDGKQIYFEEDDFDGFIERIQTMDIHYVHPVKQHPWGQRVVRFYDPDKHIIEVGENIKMVCKRFLDSGMTPQQVAIRMDVPMKFVQSCMK